MNSRIILFFINNKYLGICICIPLLIIHFINCFLEYKQKKNINIISKNKDSKFEPTIIYLLLIILSTLLIVTNIPIIKYIINFMNFSFLIYILIIAPLFNKKIEYDFIKSNTYISSFLIIELTFFILKNKLVFSNNIENETIYQFIIIFYIFIILFIIAYIFLINIKFIFYYLSSNNLKSFENKISLITKKLSIRFNLEEDKNKVKTNKNKIIRFLEVTKKLILFTTFIIVVRSLLISINYFIKTFNNCFNNINNNDIYIITKIALFTSIFSLYFIIQISNEFNSNIISSYEFIASTIIIPLLLESFLKKNNDN